MLENIFYTSISIPFYNKELGWELLPASIGLNHLSDPVHKASNSESKKNFCKVFKIWAAEI
jgi:hypothetical protein